MTTTADAPAASNGKSEGKPEEPQVLDLVSLAPTRRIVKLPTKRHPEGEQFTLRMLQDFGIEDQQKLLAWSRRHAELMDPSNMEERDDYGVLNENSRERLRFLHDNLFDMILDATPAAKKQVSDTGRNQVIQTFSWGPALANQEAQTALIRKLVDMKMVTDDQVTKAMDELKQEVLSTLDS